MPTITPKGLPNPALRPSEPRGREVERPRPPSPRPVYTDAQLARLQNLKEALARIGGVANRSGGLGGGLSSRFSEERVSRTVDDLRRLTRALMW